MRTRLYVALTCLLFTISAAAKVTQHGAASAHFRAVGPAGMKIDGTTADVTATDDGSHVLVTVDLTKLETGIALRDNHMRDKYLEVGKYPKAMLSVDAASLKRPSGTNPENFTGTGQFTVHGQTKPASFQYTAERYQNGLKITGTVNIMLTDYGIAVPNYLGVTVKPNIAIDVAFEVSDG